MFIPEISSKGITLHSRELSAELFTDAVQEKESLHDIICLNLMNKYNILRTRLRELGYDISEYDLITGFMLGCEVIVNNYMTDSDYDLLSIYREEIALNLSKTCDFEFPNSYDDAKTIFGIIQELKIMGQQPYSIQHRDIHLPIKWLCGNNHLMLYIGVL